MPETPPGRYHVALDRDGSRILDGWWDDPDTADGKFDGLQAQLEEYAGTRQRLTEWGRSQEWPLRRLRVSGDLVGPLRLLVVEVPGCRAV
ncbi:hypothetical protein ACIRL3_46140 [Streptomyces sp. NPDC102384]|uniref:hypothetical protein n=1 Tax=unclassified Streptomyces TaxID=2593676 RepID=UPI0037F66706